MMELLLAGQIITGLFLILVLFFERRLFKNQQQLLENDRVFAKLIPFDND